MRARPQSGVSKCSAAQDSLTYPSVAVSTSISLKLGCVIRRSVQICALTSARPRRRDELPLTPRCGRARRRSWVAKSAATSTASSHTISCRAETGRLSGGECELVVFGDARTGRMGESWRGGSWNQFICARTDFAKKSRSPYPCRHGRACVDG